MQVDLPTLSSRGGLGKPPEEERRVALPGTRCFDHERVESDPVNLANCGRVQVHSFDSCICRGGCKTRTRRLTKGLLPRTGL